MSDDWKVAAVEDEYEILLSRANKEIAVLQARLIACEKVRLRYYEQNIRDRACIKDLEDELDRHVLLESVEQ